MISDITEVKAFLEAMYVFWVKTYRSGLPTLAEAYYQADLLDLLNTAEPVPTVVEFKAKSIGGIAVENIEAIPDMPGIVKKTYQEKK
jgi:hypothetical protein